MASGAIKQVRRAAPRRGSPSSCPAGRAPALLLTKPRLAHYFVAHVDEERAGCGGCQDGFVRGSECTKEAIINVEAKERQRRFLSNE